MDRYIDRSKDRCKTANLFIGYLDTVSGPLMSPLPTKLLLSWEDIGTDHPDVPAELFICDWHGKRRSQEPPPTFSFHDSSCHACLPQSGALLKLGWDLVFIWNWRCFIWTWRYLIGTYRACRWDFFGHGFGRELDFWYSILMTCYYFLADY